MGKEQFSYQIAKNGKVFVYWHGKKGKREIVLKGPKADRLIAELPKMNREQEQLALAHGLQATSNEATSALAVSLSLVYLNVSHELFIESWSLRILTIRC